MKFDDLDAQMRVFETADDRCVLPDVSIVARIDGRGFTRLTKEVCRFEAPFDERFRDHMLATVEHLMQCGFQVVYGYTQSDEISLLFDPTATAFGRKIRKYVSILAGEASAKFSVEIGRPAAFDCRICELPNAHRVRNYFRWRQEDAGRNALNAHCYWMHRKLGRSSGDATDALQGMSVSAKNELLFANGINFNELPAWQKRGVGVYWKDFAKSAVNPKTGETVTAQRRRLHRDADLPSGDDYGRFVLERLT